MKRAMSVMCVVSVLALGCSLFGGGNGGNGSGVPQALLDMIVQYGGSADLESGEWHSPTAEPGMEQVHVATIMATQLAVAASPRVMAFCRTPAGATLLLKVVNYAACPVCKGAVMAGGWALVEYYKPDSPQGYIGRLYYVQKGDVVIGKPAEPSA